MIHVGSFGKTLSPALGLGFVVAPLSLAERFGEVAAFLNPAPNSTTQLALACFLAEGHYLRHLRHMKALYRARSDALNACLGMNFGVDAFAGLAVRVVLPEGSDDTQHGRTRAQPRHRASTAFAVERRRWSRDAGPFARRDQFAPWASRKGLRVKQSLRDTA